MDSMSTNCIVWTHVIIFEHCLSIRIVDSDLILRHTRCNWKNMVGQAGQNIALYIIIYLKPWMIGSCYCQSQSVNASSNFIQVKLDCPCCRWVCFWRSFPVTKVYGFGEVQSFCNKAKMFVKHSTFCNMQKGLQNSHFSIKKIRIV